MFVDLSCANCMHIFLISLLTERNQDKDELNTLCVLVVTVDLCT